MIDIPGIYVGRFKDDPNQSTMLMQIGDTPTYTDDNWANVESTGTIWRYSSEAGEWIDTGLEEILVEEVSGTKEIVAEGTVPWKLQGLNVYGKSTQASTTGAQLLPPQLASAVMQYGVTFEPLADGRLHVYGTATQDATFTGTTMVSLFAETYTLDIGVKRDSAAFRVCMTEIIGKPYLDIEDGKSSMTQTLAEPVQVSLLVRVYNGQTVDVVLSPMLCSGSTARPWEPYTGGAPSPSPDYPQPINTAGASGSIPVTVSDGADQSQQLSIQTPNGLPGIPISSGGNYTDADGQQWICDEVDFEKGVYRKTVGVIENYQSESVNEPYMSTTGQLSIGAKVIYPLSKQEETPLTDSQLQAYKALVSYDGTTVIFTDEDISGMSARVVTDVISKNAWFDPYAELALYYKALAGFESLDNLPMPHSRESSLVRKLLDSSYELGFSVTENSSRNERYLWDLINGTSTMLTNVPKSDTEKFLHVMIGGDVEQYPTVDTELDYWMDKCVNYMSSNGNIGG